MDLFKQQFDLLYLPSQGLYSTKKPFIYVKYLTAKEELILTAPMLDYTNIGLDMVLKSCIMDDDINYDDLIIPDKIALQLFLRINSFGQKIELNLICPHCLKEGKSPLDLSILQAKDVIEKPDEKGEHTYFIDNKKNNPSIKVKYKPLTISDDRKIKEELLKEENLQTAKNELLLTYKYQICSINDNEDKDYIMKSVRNLPIVVSRKMREHFNRILPEIQNDITLICEHCTKPIYDKFGLDINLIGITPSYRENLLEELFLATYYGKGITYDDVLHYSSSQRRWWINRISTEIDKKNKAEEDAVRKAKSKK